MDSGLPNADRLRSFAFIRGCDGPRHSTQQPVLPTEFANLDKTDRIFSPCLRRFSDPRVCHAGIPTSPTSLE
jgi:hypothetical protein